MFRPRRNRKSASIRALVEETSLSAKDLIAPHFLVEGQKQLIAIPSMPGVFRKSLDILLSEIEKGLSLGIKAIALFPVVEPHYKDDFGTYAFAQDNFLIKAIEKIKTAFPEICVISDIALDAYTSHGHDGIVNWQGEVLNDETLESLQKMALLHAQGGVDMVAPSDMMDGRVGALRRALEQNHYHNVNILAYSAKYASAFYGPYRDAVGSQLKFGDKKSYQLNPANTREALLEAVLDEGEGADILMVKPALCYLDIIAKIKERSFLPIAAFHVSGEYAMIKAASERGWIDEQRALLETLISIKRAGADMIITYGAHDAAGSLNPGVRG